VAGLLGIGVIAAVVISSGSAATTTPATQLPTTAALAGAAGLTAKPPWGAPDSPERYIKAAGLSVGPMGTAAHFHVHLDIFVDGLPTPVPANVGVVPATGGMSALHTHDATGILHIEAPEKDSRFTLGQFFDEWNVRLTSNAIGGLTAGSGNTLRAFVNGKQVTGDPADIELLAHQQIALVFGPSDANTPVPGTYNFPFGD